MKSADPGGTTALDSTLPAEAPELKGEIVLTEDPAVPTPTGDAAVLAGAPATPTEGPAAPGPDSATLTGHAALVASVSFLAEASGAASAEPAIVVGSAALLALPTDNFLAAAATAAAGATRFLLNSEVMPTAALLEAPAEAAALLWDAVLSWKAVAANCAGALYVSWRSH